MTDKITDQAPLLRNRDIPRYVDMAILSPALTDDEVVRALHVAAEVGAYSVCVFPAHISLAQRILAETEVKIGVVLDFPYGKSTPADKAALAGLYAAAGVDEIDMVMDYGAARSGDWDTVEAGIRAVVEAVATHNNIPIKVILETCTLTPEQITRAVIAARSAGASFVKTSTGTATGGATIEAVEQMLQAAAGEIAVKASGGIRNAQTARRYLELGVERLGIGYAGLPAIAAEPDLF